MNWWPNTKKDGRSEQPGWTQDPFAGARIVLRSKTPELVRQEVYGLLLAHSASRGLLHEATLRADVDADQLSFLHSFRVVRRKLQRFVAAPLRTCRYFMRPSSTNGLGMIIAS